MPFSILVVCTANICRSPTTMRALRAGLADAGVSPDLVVVESAGVAAADGLPMCELADTMTSAALGQPGEHRSRRLTADVARRADLILVADRGHRTGVVQLAPATRSRTFTIRQAAQLATWVVGPDGTLEVAALKAAGTVPDLPPEDLRLGVPPLPATPDTRLAWLVSELDAARGLPPIDDELTVAGWDVDDIGDPHVQGWDLHEPAVAVGLAASADLVLALRAALTMP